jgi:hypothetical protein
MARDLGFTDLETDITSRDIIASNAEQMQKMGIVIASGQDLVRGTCLGIKTGDGLYYKLDESADDGTETLAGILGCDTDATEGDEIAWAFIKGDFNIEALIATSTITPGFYNNSNVSLKITEEDD